MEPTLEGAMALARSATGPLSPHLPAYVTTLIDQRYAVVCVRAKAWHATAFDAWLSTQGVDLADVQDVHVDEFIRRPYRPRSDCQAPPRRHEPNAVRQLLGYLRGQGLCAAAPVVIVPADVLAASFAQYLRRERGLATATIGYYRTITRDTANSPLNPQGNPQIQPPPQPRKGEVPALLPTTESASVSSNSKASGDAPRTGLAIPDVIGSGNMTVAMRIIGSLPHDHTTNSKRSSTS